MGVGFAIFNLAFARFKFFVVSCHLGATLLFGRSKPLPYGISYYISHERFCLQKILREKEQTALRLNGIFSVGV